MRRAGAVVAISAWVLAACGSAYAERAPAARCADLELTHGMSGLALAEAHAARGEHEAARDALASVTAGVEAIARTIGSDAQRKSFLARPLDNNRIARVARELAALH